MSAKVGYIGGEPVIVFETYEDGTSLVGHFLKIETTGDGIEYPGIQMAAAEPGAVTDDVVPTVDSTGAPLPDAEPVYGGEAA